eukprot:330787-Lingulodinium_polyedra.AAC.1
MPRSFAPRAATRTRCNANCSQHARANKMARTVCVATRLRGDAAQTTAALCRAMFVHNAVV